MPVLAVMIDSLAKGMDNVEKRLIEKIDGIARSQDKLWGAHLQVHGDQEERTRFLERHCHTDEPVLVRVQELEKWQAGQRVRAGITGTIQTVVATAIATAVSIFGKSST